MALAGLPPPLKPWPQPWRRATPRAGGLALGDPPQLRARSRSERTKTEVSAPRPGAPRPGRPPTGRHQLPRRPRGLTPSGSAVLPRTPDPEGHQPLLPLSHPLSSANTALFPPTADGTEPHANPPASRHAPARG